MQTPTNARYLLRFDDICPTMDWLKWARVETILVERGLKPILAVIPDNQDPTLRVGPAASDFWERVRGWQRRGWTIALHGYQHRYVSSHAGMVGTRKKSEFAGLPLEAQKEKLERGLAIFEKEGIESRVWIAPGNSFDEITVSLLATLGMRVICHGRFWLPYVCGKKMTWVPQQLHCFRPAPRGIWTVCYHHNQWTEERLARFGEEINCYQQDICSLEEALEWYGGRESPWSQRICRRPRLVQWFMRCQLKVWSYWKAVAWQGKSANEVAIKVVQPTR